MSNGRTDDAGDLNRRIRESMDRIKRRLRGEMDPAENLPPAEPFVPYATIFKLDPPGENARSTVRCLNCGIQYPLADILEGELNDDQCPNCGRWALDYWRHLPHQE